MEKQYQQLQPEERLTIASMHLQGSSMRAMARMLGRSPATVSRELARNCGPDSYASVPAQALCTACEFSAYRSHFVFGVMAPPDFRRKGATAFSA